MSASPAVAVQPSLTIKRRFNAPPAKVFSAWTDPEKIMCWFGPGAVQCTHAVFELRPGGKFEIIAKSPGGETHHVGGVVREVVINEKVVYTWAWRSTPENESLVTVLFRPDGSGTLLTITHEQFVDDGARDRHNAGWTGALEKLEKFLSVA